MGAEKKGTGQRRRRADRTVRLYHTQTHTTDYKTIISSDTALLLHRLKLISPQSLLKYIISSLKSITRQKLEENFLSGRPSPIDSLG